ncbi:hypothetical protein ACFOU0_04445 [Salinicoccus sesuvii]|uniref:Uncharacterized protein n=1 Tax=Salinicoccus sesuvii TaxID=868281 RepID=A0ABV7N4T1_9STAP
MNRTLYYLLLAFLVFNILRYTTYLVLDGISIYSIVLLLVNIIALIVGISKKDRISPDRKETRHTTN